MCESCKAYEKVWHALETKLEGHAGFGLGRINMDDNLGSALAMKFDDLLAGGIPAVLWVADAAKPYAYTMVDKGNAKSGKELWQALKKAAPEAATIKGQLRARLVALRADGGALASCPAIASVASSRSVPRGCRVASYSSV